MTKCSFPVFLTDTPITPFVIPIESISPLLSPFSGLTKIGRPNRMARETLGPLPLPGAGHLLDEDPVRLFPLRRGNPDPRPQDPLLLAFDGHDLREKDEIVRLRVPVLPLPILGPFERAHLELDLLVSLGTDGGPASCPPRVEREPDGSDPPFPGAGNAGEKQETNQNPIGVNSFLHPEIYLLDSGSALLYPINENVRTRSRGRTGSQVCLADSDRPGIRPRIRVIVKDKPVAELDRNASLRVGQGDEPSFLAHLNLPPQPLHL